jgi:glutathione S-transferase
MLEWLFWEQYSHEPYIAVRRFQLQYLKRDPAQLDPKLFERGSAALARMQLALEASDYLVGRSLSLADIALVAYTRMADTAGFDLGPYPAVQAWIGRVERDLGLAG